MSPYPFLLCSKSLNRMLQKAAADDHIRGFSPCKRGPRISHLLFADDNLPFCRATMSNLQVIQSILTLYEQAFGQMLNREKTTIFFSQVVNEETKHSISNFLGILELKEYEKYLGLPIVVGRNKKVSLNYIKERVWSKLQGWKEKLLSQASREVLLKLWYKQFLHLPWVVSSYHWVSVTRLSHWLENFDGDKRVSNNKFIGKNR